MARKKGGRPAIDPARRMKRHHVMLDARTVAHAIKVGEGNLSIGLRKCVRLAESPGDRRGASS